MKDRYELPEIHQVGTADVVVQGSKAPKGQDSDIGPNRLDQSPTSD